MAITTLAGLRAAKKQDIGYTVSTTRTVTGTYWATLFACGASADIPVDGVHAGTSTTTGVVHVSGDAGFPVIQSFNGNTGVISQVAYANRTPGILTIVDVLWKGGAYAFNANTSGNTPTSFASRVPGGDYSGLEIWLEQVTTGSGAQSVNVTYTNEVGTTGRSTGTFATATNIIGRAWQLPLQADDKGVQGITGVVGSVATAGTFNILVVRPLWRGRLNGDGDTRVDGLFASGMPSVYDTSALMCMTNSDTSSMGWPFVGITIANG